MYFIKHFSHVGISCGFHLLKEHSWVSSLNDSTLGRVDFSTPEDVSSTITLYRQPREEEFEDKDWTFYVESVRMILTNSIIEIRHC